jgi:hypothetical protein
MLIEKVELGQTFIIIGEETEDKYTRVEPVFETENTFVALSGYTLNRVIFTSKDIEVKLVK